MKTKAMVGMILGIIALLLPFFSYFGFCATSLTDPLNIPETVEDPAVFSTAALISGIGLLLAVIGLIMSAVGMQECKLAGESIGMGIAGLVLSILAIVIGFSCTLCNAFTCAGILGMFD